MRNRIVPLALIALLVILHGQLWIGRGSIPNVSALTQQLAQKQALNERERQGNERLQAETGCEIAGPEEVRRAAPLDHVLVDGEAVRLGETTFDVVLSPGHTLGHVAFHFPALKALFSADSLMTHGCGRLFEGTAEQMFATIARFNALPAETRVLSGHDYARANLAFAARYAPDAPALKARQADLPRLAEEGLPTTGTTLESERLLNPYLRCHLPEVAAAAGLAGADPLSVFAAIRRQKDNA